LAICQQIVEGHGGRMWVESEVGKGTRFTFALPLAMTEASVLV
jgi:signal transduction histidine kinase